MNNKEIYTTFVKLKGSNEKELLVKSNKPVNEELFEAFSETLKIIRIAVPVKCGDVVCTNLLNTGIDIISARTVEK